MKSTIVLFTLFFPLALTNMLMDLITQMSNPKPAFPAWVCLGLNCYYTREWRCSGLLEGMHIHIIKRGRQRHAVPTDQIWLFSFNPKCNFLYFVVGLKMCYYYGCFSLSFDNSGAQKLPTYKILHVTHHQYKVFILVQYS